jgi:hypothetical protein
VQLRLVRTIAMIDPRRRGRFFKHFRFVQSGHIDATLSLYAVPGTPRPAAGLC